MNTFSTSGYELPNTPELLEECGATVINTSAVDNVKSAPCVLVNADSIGKEPVSIIPQQVKKLTDKVRAEAISAKEELKNKYAKGGNDIMFSDIPFVDFIKRMFSDGNKWEIILFVFNCAVIAGILYFFSDGEIYGKMLFMLSFGLNIISMVIALSPVGEWLLRRKNGCRKMTRTEQIERIAPIVEEVYSRAKAADPRLTEEISFFVSEDDDVNAFATGKRTICMTTGLLIRSDEEIAAVLAHEFGHISNRHTDATLFVCVGNIFISLLQWIARFVMQAFADMGKNSNEDIVKAVAAFFQLLAIAAYVILNIWQLICLLASRKADRKNEYVADEFAFNLGYGDGLCKVLDSFHDNYKKEGFFKRMMNSHPYNDERIAALQNLGAAYRTVNC